MELIQYKIKDEIYSFPKTWNINEVVNWTNTNIRICPNCNKIDVDLNHFDDCNPKIAKYREQTMEKYYD